MFRIGPTFARVLGRAVGSDATPAKSVPPPGIDRYSVAPAGAVSPATLVSIADLPARSVLFAFDWDGTLAADVDATSAALAGMGDAPFVMINTGRSLADLQHSADEVGTLDRLDAIACCNGTLVFTNDAGLPAKEFLEGLTLDDAAPAWTDQIAAQTGWEQQTVLTELEAFLAEAEAGGAKLSRYWDDGVEFNGHGDEGKQLADAFVARLAECGVDAQYEVEHWTKCDTFKTAPLGIDKARPVAFQSGQLDLRALVTAGDGDNDLAILRRATFEDAGGHPISNQPVVIIPGTYHVVMDHQQGEAVPQNKMHEVDFNNFLNADKVLSVDVPVVRVDPSFTLDNQPFADSFYQSAAFYLREIHAPFNRIFLGFSYKNNQPVMVIEEDYDVVYEHINGDQVPQNTNSTVTQIDL